MCGEVGRRSARARVHHQALPRRGDDCPRCCAGCERAGRRAQRRRGVVPRCSSSPARPRSRWPAAAAATRKQIAFYGSTPAYRRVLELHGWGDLHTELHRLSQAGRVGRHGRRSSTTTCSARSPSSLRSPKWPARCGSAVTARSTACCPPFPPGSPEDAVIDARASTSVRARSAKEEWPMDNIRGRTVAITGAARGIGYATAEALLARGARVVIGDRDVARPRVGGRRPCATRARCPGIRSTSPTAESFATFLDKARTDGGGHLDVLINNAGVMPVGPFLDQSEQAIRSVDRGELLRRAHRVPAGAARDGEARAAATSSTSRRWRAWSPCRARWSMPGTKFAVVGLSTAMADEFAPHGVEVSVVMPPFTNTELISGTKHRSRPTSPWSPRTSPRPSSRCLNKPKTHVSVPGGVRFVLTITNLLGPRGRRWLNRRTGTDRVFLDLDVAARRSYEERAQAATGRGRRTMGAAR